MFKCINNLAPEYLCSMFNSINENCPYVLRIVLVLPLAGKFGTYLAGQFQKLKTNVTH
jgi:hypothetical protein